MLRRDATLRHDVTNNHDVTSFAIRMTNRSFFQKALVDHIGVYKDTNNVMFGRWR